MIESRDELLEELDQLMDSYQERIHAVAARLKLTPPGEGKVIERELRLVAREIEEVTQRAAALRRSR